MRTAAAQKRSKSSKALVAITLVAALCGGVCGCTSFGEYVRNGFKVGPNYVPPDSPVASEWIDAKDPHLKPGDPNIASWWCTFDDPVLNELVRRAYAQNLTVRAAGFRILEARAQRAFALGNILPQTQTFDASYTRIETSGNQGGSFVSRKNNFFDRWGTSLNMAWEVDFWGKFRRAVESANAVLDAAAADYDDVVVLLVSEVASTYVQMRTLQKRLDLARKNVDEQVPMVKIMESRFKAEVKDSLPDYNQLKANLDQTRALIPQLEISLRVLNNNLGTLLGNVPRDLLPELGDGRVPDPDDKEKTVVRIPHPVQEDLVVGIPAQSLLNRPDVRRAERLVAAQSAQIGIAVSEWYPHISLNGTIGLEANSFPKLFNARSWFGDIGPSLSWNILNYGRILANVRLQDAKFQELAATYENTLLTANQEAESGIVAYLKSLERYKNLQDSADAAAKVTTYLLKQKEKGFGADTTAFINRLFTAQNFKVQQQDAAAQSEGDIALALIQVYKALGGGWQIRQGADCEHNGTAPPAVPNDLPEARRNEEPASPATQAKKSASPAPKREVSRQIEMHRDPIRPAATRNEVGQSNELVQHKETASEHVEVRPVLAPPPDASTISTASP
jgi:NodT family efflux transporter outer membrane factor (OMF) lipoprotein